MYCEHCSKEISEDSHYCRYCGFPIKPKWNNNIAFRLKIPYYYEVTGWFFWRTIGIALFAAFALCSAILTGVFSLIAFPIYGLYRLISRKKEKENEG